MNWVSKLFALSFLTVLSYQYSQCQPEGSGLDNTRPTTIVPPSPVASSLLKDVNVPVNYFTGTAQINIPLYSIKIGSIEMPINFGYASNGIKVEEEAGWTGLGWNLDVGGVIGRSIIGSADERKEFGNGGAGYRQSASLLGMPDPANDIAFTQWSTNLTACVQKDIAEGRSYNLMPDIYFMKFNGHSARLFFDKDKKPFISPYKAWKIKGNENEGFVVTTEDGMIYEFKLIENTETSITSSQDLPDPPSANTSWHLTRIITPNFSDTLTFNYLPVTYSFDAHNPEESYQKLVPAQVVVGGAPLGESRSTSLLNQNITGYILASITSRNQKVEFNASMNRLDIPNNLSGMPYKLDGIKIFRTSQGGSEVLLKRIIFNYNYFNSNRLKLTSLSLSDPLISTSQTYNFDYYEGLPAKNSKSQDYWGYYNAASNSTLIPTFTGIYGENYAGADRTANTNFANVGMLKQIQYPTGGYTNFEYETHDYPSNPTREPSVVSQTASVNANQPPQTKTFQFSVPYSQFVNISSFVYQRNGGNDGEAYITITDGNNDIKYYTNQTTNEGSVSLSAGTYTLTAVCTYQTENARATVKYNVYASSISSTYRFYGGGSRIKRIIQSDNINSPIVKVFKYSLKDGNSSGISFNHLLIYGDFQYTPKIVQGTLPIKVGDYQYYARHSTSSVSLGTSQGSYAGYSLVTVLHGENGENGREEFTYTTKPADGGGVGYPYAPLSSFDDLRGLLLDHKQYDKSGRLLQRTANGYNLNNNAGSPNFKWITGVKIGIRRTNITSGDCSSLPGSAGWLGWQFGNITYKIYQFWPTLASTTSTTYSSTSNDSITTATQITYDPENLQAVSRLTMSSKGETILTSYKYPKDFAGTPVYDTMIARNMISEIVEVDEYKNSNLTSKVITDFSLWNNNKKVLPSYKRIQIGNSPIETRLQYFSYDTYDNLLEQSKSDDAHEVYLYGYNNVYPVAKIVGSDYTTVSSIINNHASLNNPPDDESMRTYLNTLRSSLPNALVTTFTYSPLIGLTSQTDPSGMTIFYEYDGLGRLDNIRDQDRNVLKKFQYNYATAAAQSSSASAASMSGILSDFRKLRSGDIKRKFVTSNATGTTLLTDPRDFYRDGVAKLPEAYRTRPATWYATLNLRLDEPYHIEPSPRLCFMQQGYSVEWRVKMPANSYNIYNSGSYIYYFNIDNSFSAIFEDRYDQGTGNGTYLTRYDDPDGKYGGTHNNPQPGPNMLFADQKKISSDHLFNDFHTVKLQVTDNEYIVSFDGSVVYSRTRDKLSNGNNATVLDDRLYVDASFYGNDCAVDWIRISDKDGVARYYEDFSNPSSPATIGNPSTTICAYDSNCQEAFKVYYNLRTGGNKTYAEIAQLYQQTTGEALNVCN